MHGNGYSDFGQIFLLAFYLAEELIAVTFIAFAKASVCSEPPPSA